MLDSIKLSVSSSNRASRIVGALEAFAQQRTTRYMTDLLREL
jgi:hypothetical protein